MRKVNFLIIFLILLYTAVFAFEPKSLSNKLAFGGGIGLSSLIVSDQLYNDEHLESFEGRSSPSNGIFDIFELFTDDGLFQYNLFIEYILNDNFNLGIDTTLLRWTRVRKCADCQPINETNYFAEDAALRAIYFYLSFNSNQILKNTSVKVGTGKAQYSYLYGLTNKNNVYSEWYFSDLEKMNGSIFSVDLIYKIRNLRKFPLYSSLKLSVYAFENGIFFDENDFDNIQPISRRDREYNKTLWSIGLNLIFYYNL